MATTLSLETSTQVCSVALHRNNELLAATELHLPQSHASRLAVIMDDIVSLAAIEINELKAIAVSAGPGSYTGLRIGASTAKGLCYALGIPLIGVNTLDILAFQMSKIVTTDTLLCPMIDARRMEVYCKITDTELNEIRPIEALEVHGDSFGEILETRQIVFFGNGAGKCKSVIQHPNALFINGINPLAAYLGYLAAEKLRTNQVEDLESFEPFYLKEFFVVKKSKNISVASKSI